MRFRSNLDSGSYLVPQLGPQVRVVIRPVLRAVLSPVLRQLLSFILIPALVLLLLMFQVSAFATEQITFSDDVLPSESVIPDLDSKDMVLKKNLIHEKRFEIKTDVVWGLDELFNNGKIFGFNVVYYLNNDFGLGLKYYSYTSSLNEYGNQFESRGIKLGQAPKPTSIFAFSLVNQILYGKINISQDLTLPLTVDIQYDLGVNKYGSSVLPYAAVGVGNKLYFKKNFLVEIAYFLQYHQVINPLSVNIRTAPVPDEAAFAKPFQLSQSLSLGLGYLF